MRKQSLLVLALIIGTVSAFPESRVVNGTNTKENYPYMVSLRYASGSHSCGGTIIAPRWILTAAHCLLGTARLISVEFGENEVNPHSINVAYAERIFRHKQYNPFDAHANDIGLLYLKRPLTFDGKTVAPVNLPAQGYDIPQVPHGTPGKLLGWGLNASGGVWPKHLQEVDLKIYSDQECWERYHGVTTPKHICGGVDEGGKGQCSGDSGGPLIEKSGLTQLGIVSWSIHPCATYPGVYTKVSAYIDWIHQQMGSMAE